VNSIGDWVDLCATDEIADPGSHGFSIDIEDGESLALFVVHRNGGFFAYVKRCPHTGAPLEWTPHQFLDLDNSFIQCAMHGALFRPEDGYCLRGPCVGRSLQALELAVSDSRIRVRVATDALV
jgi:nitrite reductase/ring-hydroxylating ferredoxin subunit